VGNIHCRSISSNRSKRGMYDGRDIRSGNKISFSNKKTRRKFRPNVLKKRLYSEIMGTFVGPFHVTAGTLRTIDAYGGVDNYVMKSNHIKPPATKKSLRNEGWIFKKKLMQKLKNNKWKKKRGFIENGFDAPTVSSI